MMVRREVHGPRSRVVEIGEGDTVLRSDLMADDDLVDVVELIPVFLITIHVTEQGLELWSPRHGDIQRLSGEKRLLVEQVPVIPVRNHHEVVSLGSAFAQRPANSEHQYLNS